MKIVLIEWVDITKHNTGWIPAEAVVDNMRFMRCKSVGFIVAETEEAVVISQTVTDEQITDPLVIPRRVIKKIRKLR